ncbi:hypothetical protein QF031_000939 [Pseudarthrobacter defluvii]|uniref:hypothetical protein n=1 Tax=Pseudarthrobacter defluvii TaxID=410837 RepID=UPI00277DFE9C|nr:hypothetical protein [Pseudarthrobacter defluvii]MDQ0768190.1 hypothetical protein [Pseudarthrobacter defluvii]
MSNKGFVAETIALAKADPAGAVTGLAGVVGVGVALMDLFTPFELPADVPDEVFLFGLSTFLLSVYGASRLRRIRDKEERLRDDRHDLLLGQIAQLVEEAELRQVPSGEINTLLVAELSSTSGWWFRGGSGRWFSRTVLPALAERKVPQPVSIQILDPRDKHLCARYASYRSQQRDPADIRDNESDPRAIQTDLLACILSARVHASHSRINEDIVLLRTYSPMRIDMGSSMLLATVASQTAPALMARHDSFFYKSIKDEFESAAHGHAVLRSNFDDRRIPRPKDMTAESARAVLEGYEVIVGEEQPTSLLSGFARAEDLNFEDIYRKAFCVDA